MEHLEYVGTYNRSGLADWVLAGMDAPRNWRERAGRPVVACVLARLAARVAATGKWGVTFTVHGRRFAVRPCGRGSFAVSEYVSDLT
jgi:hypothetical protein